MKVSKRGQYGMRALCHLAETHGSGVVQIREIARKESIPAKFLEGILLELKHAGIVRARRGIDGGYELARDPAEIMLGQVMRVLDGPLAPLGKRRGAQRADEERPATGRFLFGPHRRARRRGRASSTRRRSPDVVARNSKLEGAK